MSRARMAVAMMVAVLVGGVASGVAAQPALAACATDGHVYLTSPGPFAYRFETDPVDNFPTLIAVPFVPMQNVSLLLKVGGNGIKPGTTPTWNVYRPDNTFVKTIRANKAGSNCVANEREQELGQEFEGLFIFKASYDAGNSGRAVRGQNHFVVHFDPTIPPF
ncbi:hypothetical protein Rhe02_88730 [Rhizocola hellebori]|uniref:Secreted protein n=1 Tax=Rhizocola hellebori TaxID=1392758 RepID=A0A8J3QKJ4_9ACTN|nr:hypothetical protein [Rhizocola hellebori]GIH10806.1 hypothetical protein Rhe02_88730 [Rhizocola hellebori]